MTDQDTTLTETGSETRVGPSPVPPPGDRPVSVSAANHTTADQQWAERWAYEHADHECNGLCPDEDMPDVRDPDCDYCKLMVALAALRVRSEADRRELIEAGVAMQRAAAEIAALRTRAAAADQLVEALRRLVAFGPRSAIAEGIMHRDKRAAYEDGRAALAAFDAGVVTANHTEQEWDAMIAYAEHLAERHARGEFEYPELNRKLHADYRDVLSLANALASERRRADNLANTLREYRNRWNGTGTAEVWGPDLAAELDAILAVFDHDRNTA